MFQMIPYNQAADPNQYIAQGLQNLLNPMLMGRDFSQIANWLQGGMTGQAPMVGQTGQNLISQLLFQQPRIEASVKRAAQPKQTTQIQQIEQSFDSDLDALLLRLPGAVTRKRDELDPTGQGLPQFNTDFAPTPAQKQQIDSLITEWVDTKAGLTGISAKVLKKMAIARVKNRIPNYDKTAKSPKPVNAEDPLGFFTE